MTGLYRSAKRFENARRDNSAKAAVVLNILIQELPFCFIKDGIKKPLKPGVYQDLLAHYRGEIRFTIYELRTALHCYAQNQDYLQSVKTGADCINLQGQVCGKVSDDIALRAKTWPRHI